MNTTSAARNTTSVDDTNERFTHILWATAEAISTSVRTSLDVELRAEPEESYFRVKLSWLDGCHLFVRIDRPTGRIVVAPAYKVEYEGVSRDLWSYSRPEMTFALNRKPEQIGKAVAKKLVPALLAEWADGLARAKQAYEEANATKATLSQLIGVVPSLQENSRISERDPHKWRVFQPNGVYGSVSVLSNGSVSIDLTDLTKEQAAAMLAALEACQISV